jgi:hypothetical protein
MRPAQNARSPGRRSRGRPLARLLGLAAWVLGVGACQPDDVTRPAAGESAGEPSRRAAPAPGELTGLGIGLDDAASRLSTTFGNRVAAAMLRAHLRELAVHLESGDRPKARRALALARRALNRAGGVGASESVNGSAIRLVLDQAELLLNGEPPSAGEPAPTSPDTTTSSPSAATH